MIDRRRDRALYQELAAELRRQIFAGELPASADLPSEKVLAPSSGLGRDAVRQALAVLRSEGLVVSEQGRPSRVRELRSITTDCVPPPAAVRARMPLPEERARFDLADGVPVLVVRTGSQERIYPRTALRFESALRGLDEVRAVTGRPDAYCSVPDPSFA